MLLKLFVVTASIISLPCQQVNEYTDLKALGCAALVHDSHFVAFLA
jgi:hypothetical protein